MNSQRYGLQKATTIVLAISTSIFGAITLPTPAVYAQTLVSGDVTGTITDTTGAAVPNVQVVLKSPSTGETRTVTTNGAGSFRIPLLKPGPYTVTATLVGFQTTSTSGQLLLAARSVMTRPSSSSIQKACASSSLRVPRSMRRRLSIRPPRWQT